MKMISSSLPLETMVLGLSFHIHGSILGQIAEPVASESEYEEEDDEEKGPELIKWEMEWWVQVLYAFIYVVYYQICISSISSHIFYVTFLTEQ
jgi:hypothetical protein